MGKRVHAVCAVVLSIGLALPLAGCQKLKARMAIRDAHALYKAQEYKRAAAKYEEALEADPQIEHVHFFLANSYDLLYKPTRKGERENDELLTKAIEHYRKAADTEQNANLKKRSLEYLAAVYGPEKLNEPEKAEQTLQELVRLDPNDVTYYAQLAKIYEDVGNYEQAEATLIKARDARPNDPAVYTQLANFYNRQGEFPKTMDALKQRAEREPNNPEAHYTIASYYWDAAYRDPRLTEAQKKEYIAAGMTSIDRALELNPNYMEAVVYKGLLLRLQANLEKDRDRQQALLKQAEELQSRAKELQKKKAAGLG